MKHHRFTPVPNNILDTYLPILKPTEVALLLVIIRQTSGWQNKRTKERKYKDWISGSQLRSKTGYSRKAISCALQALTTHHLIKIYDILGNEVHAPNLRQGKTKLYYAFHYIPSPVEILPTCVKSTQHLRTFYAQQKKLLQKKLVLYT
ncbi:MAG: replication protein [Chitinophagales bacterium]|nr:replication protein [Chitinophagales bacterium]